MRLLRCSNSYDTCARPAVSHSRCRWVATWLRRRDIRCWRPDACRGLARSLIKSPGPTIGAACHPPPHAPGPHLMRADGRHRGRVRMHRRHEHVRAGRQPVARRGRRRRPERRRADRGERRRRRQAGRQAQRRVGHLRPPGARKRVSWTRACIVRARRPTERVRVCPSAPCCQAVQAGNVRGARLCPGTLYMARTPRTRNLPSMPCTHASLCRAWTCRALPPAGAAAQMCFCGSVDSSPQAHPALAHGGGAHVRLRRHQVVGAIPVVQLRGEAPRRGRVVAEERVQQARAAAPAGACQPRQALRAWQTAGRRARRGEVVPCVACRCCLAPRRAGAAHAGAPLQRLLAPLGMPCARAPAQRHLGALHSMAANRRGMRRPLPQPSFTKCPDAAAQPRHFAALRGITSFMITGFLDASCRAPHIRQLGRVRYPPQAERGVQVGVERRAGRHRRAAAAVQQAVVEQERLRAVAGARARRQRRRQPRRERKVRRRRRRRLRRPCAQATADYCSRRGVARSITASTTPATGCVQVTKSQAHAGRRR